MYFHIILTERCNSKCRYCYEKSMQEFDNALEDKFEFDFSAPCDTKIDIQKLKQFLEKDPEPKLIFYGGEPLVNQEKLIQIMDALKDVKNIEFFMQTNAKLLDKFPKEYMNQFKRILVSCDGDKERTDFNRGEGTYDKVLENLKLIRENGYKNEIVARMTISFSDEFTDLTKQIKHLFSAGFDSVHWQLDMGFYKFDYEKQKVENFIQEYNKEITKLLEYWLEEIQKGKVLKIYPFLGIFESIYYNTKTKLRCGSGYANYTITTDGKLTCCPIMNNIKDFYVGDIQNSDPKNLKEISVSTPCDKCEYLNLCGGRCLYSNYAKLWPKEGENLVCSTIKHLIDEIKKITSQIKELIKQRKVLENDFKYEKYFGPEIIP